MPVNITMPALSPTMEEGNLSKWNVSEGDAVSAGDVIAEIETDKATMEVESIDDGILGKILVPEGSQGVKVNSVIAVLLAEDEDIGDIGVMPSAQSEKTGREAVVPDPLPASAAAPATATVAPARDIKRVVASPLARRLARESNIDLASVTGSGPGNRIIKRDIEQAIRNGATQAEVTPVSQHLSGMADADVIALYDEGTYEMVANDSMRKIIAKRLTQAKQTVPHFYLSIDCCVDQLLEARAQINATAKKDREARPEFKLSVNDFIIKAWAMTMQRVPDANVSWAGEYTLRHRHSDIAVAVSVPGGLFTPVIKQAELKSLRAISAEVRDFAARARQKKLAPHEYQGGSTSVSNLGMFGISHFQAVINPPHGSILAIGASEERVVARNGDISVGNFMTVTMSCDHRAVDGVLGAEALGMFKQLIETPVMMLT